LSNLPYITAHGNIAKALEAIQKAAVPDKVSGDFVKTILGIKGGSGDQVTSLLKKIGLVDASGSPTSRYNQFRNPTTSGIAIAEAMRTAYKPLFDRNEHIYAVGDEELKGLIVEETGHAHDSTPVKMIHNCFKALNSFANFGTTFAASAPEDLLEKPTGPNETLDRPKYGNNGSPKLNIGYNIHLNLPATDDIAVFNAIFKSLRENLLVDGDE
jgi:hypothetical protein